MKLPKVIEQQAEARAEALAERHLKTMEGYAEIFVRRTPDEELDWECAADWLHQFYTDLNRQGFTGWDLPQFDAIWDVADAIVMAVGHRSEMTPKGPSLRWIAYAFEFTEMGASCYDKTLLGHTQ